MTCKTLNPPYLIENRTYQMFKMRNELISGVGTVATKDWKSFVHKGPKPILDDRDLQALRQHCITCKIVPEK